MNLLIIIKRGSDDIDCDPDEPLLKVFVSQRPDTDDTECGCEAVCKWDIGVGERDKHPIDERPDGSNEDNPRKNQLTWETRNRLLRFIMFFLPLLPEQLPSCFPDDESIDSHEDVIELHSTVGV